MASGKQSRRGFLAACAAGLAAGAEPVIDIHQHTNYSGRTDEELVSHQRRMGISRTVLLPAGSRFGLAVGAGGNDTVAALARRYPGEFSFFANELPDIPETRAVLERCLKAGAIGIGEQKFPVDCDSRAIHLVAEIAREFDVPVLLHFQHGQYNRGYARFHTVLERHRRVNFIGHAQTFWGHISRDLDETVLYPKSAVIAGGLTDRWLSDYPNFYGDLSAGSGLNALLRDEENARAFLERHQDKLLFGSDCKDRAGAGPACSGSRQLETVRRLAPDAAAARKVLYQNAARLLRIA